MTEFKSLEELRREVEKLKLEGEDLQHLRDKCEEFKLMRTFKKTFRKWEFDWNNISLRRVSNHYVEIAQYICYRRKDSTYIFR